LVRQTVLVNISQLIMEDYVNFVVHCILVLPAAAVWVYDKSNLISDHSLDAPSTHALAYD